jgi:hypothetical protein
MLKHESKSELGKYLEIKTHSCNYEKMSPNTFKWFFTLGVEILMFQIFMTKSANSKHDQVGPPIYNWKRF